MDEHQIIELLRNTFNNDEIKREVLDDEWYELNIESGINSTGFCFSASEVLYRLTGGNDNWQIKYLQDPTHWENGTHYFLKRRANNEIVDITADQYTEIGVEIPYNLARGTGLRNISNKARILAQLSGIGEL